MQERHIICHQVTYFGQVLRWKDAIFFYLCNSSDAWFCHWDPGTQGPPKGQIRWSSK